MSVDNKYNALEDNFNNKLDALLQESRYEMQERTQMILLGINSHAAEAKKDVHHHIAQLVKIQSVLSNTTTH